MDLGFMGPNYSISTACATANYCFVAAANHIRKGDADIIIAGGSEAPIIPVGLGGFVACRWDCVSVVPCCCSLAEMPCKKVTENRHQNLDDAGGFEWFSMCGFGN